MENQYLKLYDLENYLLTDVKDNFHNNGYLNSFEFFCIIIWKANRAKSKIASRLVNNNESLDASIKHLTEQIYLASDNRRKLEILIVEYHFRLPMASAILSILYPELFTIFDFRVCDTFSEFRNIDNLSFNKLWIRYSEYIERVRNYGTINLSLRDKDRLLWGKSFKEQLELDLQTNFIK